MFLLNEELFGTPESSKYQNGCNHFHFQETLEERPACVDAMVELLEIAGKGFGPRP